ncbi:hypothetical protein [Paraburkholderia sp. GAS42]|jgi:hypothetical protein|uniref:hypothetical protein n=1 Tax=Paraburkholderia sp. GAS42 TaxID=3035135 RepID=UPI003D19C14F
MRVRTRIDAFTVRVFDTTGRVLSDQVVTDSLAGIVLIVGSSIAIAIRRKEPEALNV